MSTVLVRKLDDNHDMTFGQGSSNYIADLDAVSQMIVTKLLLFVGEWWQDLNDGLPLWQKILGKVGASKKVIDGIIQDRILQVPYVTGISSFYSQMDMNARTYKAAITIDTYFGQVSIMTGG